jgi:intracellular septation protein A
LINIFKALFKRLRKLLHNNKSLKELALEFFMTGILCCFTSNLTVITTWLISYLVGKMILDYRKNGSFSHTKIGLYLFGMLFLLSTLIFHDIRFIQAKIIAVSYALASMILLSPYYMETPHHYFIYASLLGDQTKETYDGINIVTGLYTLCIFALNIWIASNFPSSIWLWFKTAITPLMILAYIFVQFCIWNKH